MARTFSPYASTYSFADYLVLVDGFPATGHADGDGFSFARNKDNTVLKKGVDGTGVFEESQDKSGVIKLRLMAHSPMIDYLEAFRQANEAGGYIQHVVKIAGPAVALLATGCKIKRLPDMAFGESVPVVEYEFLCNELNAKLSGLIPTAVT